MTSHVLKMCTIKCILNAILLEHNKSLKHNLKVEFSFVANILIVRKRPKEIPNQVNGGIDESVFKYVFKVHFYELHY